MRHFSWNAIPLEEIASLPNFYGPSVSPDHDKIAFYWDKSGALELYVMPTVPGGTPKQVSDGQLPKALHAGFVWSSDGKNIFFAKDNDGDEQHNIWRINLESGQTEQLTNNPKAQEYPVEASPDGKTLLVLSNLYGQLNLLALDLKSREYQQLTHYAFPVDGAKYSPDGSQIAYVTNETNDLNNLDVYLMNADGSNQRRVVQVKVGSQDNIADWSKDGRYLAIGSDAGGKGQIGLYDVVQADLRWISPADKEQSPGKFSPDSQQLLGYNNEDATFQTTVYNVSDGKQQSVELPPGLSYNADWLGNDRFMVSIMTDVTRPELRDYRLADGGSDVLLHAEYGSINPALFTKHEYVSYKSSDGMDIHAVIYRPRDLKPGQKYPALVEVHGGPTGQFFRAFDPYGQFLADNGFIVIQPNVRGSTGYGVEFRDLNRMDWGGGDLEDVAGAAAYLKSLPEVDSERVGVWGGSYGGYMTYMAMTKKPDLWKAGVAWVGITDLKKLYESSMEHFKYYLKLQMGDPQENADLWQDRSAVNFAQQMTAKMLIVHGINDPRCPIEQARIFRDRLVELGKVEGRDFEYVELAEEGHGSTDIGQKIRSYRLLVDFMQRSL
ncbi:MAG: S9 family peptidase [Chloroflexota bacterium]